MAANTATTARTVTGTVAGQTFSVTQAAASCTYSISPASASAAAAGTSGTITVTTQAGCAWSASQRQQRPHLPERDRTHRVRFGHVHGGGQHRHHRATLTGNVAGKTLTVSQARPRPCTYSINPAAINVFDPAASGTITGDHAGGLRLEWRPVPAAS